MPHIYANFDMVIASFIILHYYEPPRERIYNSDKFYNWVFILFFPEYGAGTYLIYTNFIQWYLFR